MSTITLLQGISGQKYAFQFFEKLTPDRDYKGNIKDYTYTDRAVGGERNPDGNGPFCDFSLKNKRNDSCVYLWCDIENKILYYIGKTDNLQQRFKEYGHISPADCKKKDGNSTNCRMNHALWRHKEIDLYVYPTCDPDGVEKDLLENITTLYNVQEN